MFCTTGTGKSSSSKSPRRSQESSSKTQVPLLLHFDVNKTVIQSDSVQMKGVEEGIREGIADLFWGTETWEWIKAEPSCTPPKDDILAVGTTPLNYTQWCKRAHGKDKKAMKEAVRSFSLVHGKPVETEMKKLLQLTIKKMQLRPEVRKSKEAEVAGLQGPTFNMFPALFHLVAQLQRQRRPFGILFRSFGADHDKIQREWNAFCELRHPIFSRLIEDLGPMDGSDSRIPDRRIHSIHTVYRDAHGPMVMLDTFTNGPEDQPWDQWARSKPKPTSDSRNGKVWAKQVLKPRVVEGMTGFRKFCSDHLTKQARIQWKVRGTIWFKLPVAKRSFFQAFLALNTSSEADMGWQISVPEDEKMDDDLDPQQSHGSWRSRRSSYGEKSGTEVTAEPSTELRPPSGEAFDPSLVEGMIRVMMMDIGGLIGFLKKSDVMLIVWDPTWTERLWCLFELAAFLKSKDMASAKQKLIVRPIFFGPISMAIFLFSFAVAFPLTTVPLPEPVNNSTLGVIFVLGPALVSGLMVAYPTVMTLRIYFRDLDIMKKQLLGISFDRTRSSCCDQEHQTSSGTPMLCDRKATAAIKDDWAWWQFHSEQAHAGKLMTLLRRKESAQVFFDDNIEPFDARIVDCRDEYDKSVADIIALEKYLVKVNPVEAMLDENYFWRKLLATQGDHMDVGSSLIGVQKQLADVEEEKGTLQKQLANMGQQIKNLMEENRRMKQQRRIPVRDENDLHSILQKDGIDVKQFGAGQLNEVLTIWVRSRASGVVLLASGGMKTPKLGFSA
eukprot:symbB.v1.2.025664.t2/scaffold2506.1/size77480/1